MSKKRKAKKIISCPECRTQSDCCQLGAWIDLDEAKKIISREIKGDFFHLEKDKDFPSGYRIGTSFEDESCSFLGADGLCLIHKVDYSLKPKTCKDFPYENNKLSPFADVLCTPFKSRKNKKKRKEKVMRKIILLSVFVLLCCFGICLAQNSSVEFEGRYWIADLDAQAKVERSGIGDKFDLKSDLGVKDEDFPEGRFYWHTGPNSKLRFAYTQAGFDGDETVTRTTEFKGQTFTAGTRVVSDLGIKYFRFGWIWQFLNMASEKIKIGSVLEAKVISVNVSLEAPNLVPAVKEKEEFVGGLPTVGLALDINPIKKINLFAEISGIGAGSLGYFFDAEAGIKFMPIKNISFIGGYRFIGFKAEDDKDFARLDLKGPFLGATLEF
jgi:Fe-S-cluster containining protein